MGPQRIQENRYVFSFSEGGAWEGLEVGKVKRFSLAHKNQEMDGYVQ